ncbi:aminoglycoside phosphotransferase family protein [Paenibacillus sp. EC2-1]|uniref:aminoglycoside phosphotransferase family protein n=1 Tax=Paenibacillus sp. EC2-1 TaxID=3388665 RepID=UPI003BEEF9D4
MDEVFTGIPSAETWKIVEEIHKGWSADKKYYIQTVDGTEMLLRMSDLSQYEKKKIEFESMKLLNGIDVPMSRPIEFGLCNNGQSVFSLLTWMEGEDAGEVIALLSAKEQYLIGVKAGEYLRRIHQVPANHDEQTWSEYYNCKIDKYIANYKDCGIYLKEDQTIMRYVEQNRYLLDDRPNVFQHGDYHLGNMVVTSSGDLGIIDFNRFDYGDPWEEFNRISFDASVSEYFASGRINGYFNHDVPDAFFRLMALYLASNQLSSVSWAIPFGEAEVNFMLKRAANVMEWFDGFQKYVPTWYIPRFGEIPE